MLHYKSDYDSQLQSELALSGWRFIGTWSLLMLLAILNSANRHSHIVSVQSEDLSVFVLGYLLIIHFKAMILRFVKGLFDFDLISRSSKEIGITTQPSIPSKMMHQMCLRVLVLRNSRSILTAVNYLIPSFLIQAQGEYHC